MTELNNEGLVLNDIRVELGGFSLGPVSFSLVRGGVCVVSGSSGCGKSTLLRIIAGLQAQDTGSVSFAGIPIRVHKNFRHMPEDHLFMPPVPLVFQEFQLWPHLNVLDNVALVPEKAFGLSRAQAQHSSKLLLKEVGLGQRLDAYPETLSGGEAQRVALARALAVRPQLILLDEITSALDSVSIGLILEVLTQYRERGLTMVVVTHQQRIAKALGNIFLRFHNGNAALLDSADEAFA